VTTIGEYNELAAAFAESPVIVLGVSLDETEEEARAFAEAKHLNHPVIYQGSWSQSTLRKAYRVNGIPFTVVIGADGTVLHQNLHGDLLKETVARNARALTDIVQ
jgi:peroxiredoxin